MLTSCFVHTSDAKHPYTNAFWLRSRSPLCQRHPFFTDPPALI
ncbi:hypothetical protein O59_000545 [Cellvibrio sp. BR]|nr:hypothetical protein O59_000545 [Cellvibrio sp. BR]